MNLGKRYKIFTCPFCATEEPNLKDLNFDAEDRVCTGWHILDVVKATEYARRIVKENKYHEHNLCMGFDKENNLSDKKKLELFYKITEGKINNVEYKKLRKMLKVKLMIECIWCKKSIVLHKDYLYEHNNIEKKKKKKTKHTLSLINI